MVEERAQFKNPPPLATEGVSFRMPPQNKDAEMSVLGSLMLDKNAPMKIMDTLAHDDFYYENHRLIYETIIALFEKHEPIDVLSVSSRLKEKGQLEHIGGMSYIAHLVNTVPSTAGIAHYADIVNKKRVLRDLIEASQQVINDDKAKAMFGLQSAGFCANL